MFRNLTRKISTLIVAAVLSLNLTSIAKADVIELALVLDGSGSIGQTDFDLQTGAYANIFANNFVSNYVAPGDTLYVSIWVFATNVTQIVGATLLGDDAAATTFAGNFGTIAWPNGWTNTPAAIDDAANDLINNGIASDKMIIDISTDGDPRVSGAELFAETVTSATNANAAGVTVNAIGVGSGIDLVKLDAITTAGGGFFTTADNFNEFETALERKLRREIQGIPEPGSILLLSIGAMLLAFRRR